MYTALRRRRPTLYHAGFPAATGGAPDATLEFQQSLNDPRRWVKKEGVPIFKCHERVDPASGKQIVVDPPKLYRIAQNLQRMERQGVPIRMTVGHTEPNKSEPHQPPLSGFYINPRIQTFGPKQELAIVCDELLDPTYAASRKNFPYRSSEYYDDDEQITGVALLARDPFLDLGVVSYGRRTSGPIHYSRGNNGRVSAFYCEPIGDESMFPQRRPTPMTHWMPQSPMVDTGYPIGTPPGYQPRRGANYYADYRQPSQYSAPWPGGGVGFTGDSSTYNPRQTIPHEHTSTGAIYAEDYPGGAMGRHHAAANRSRARMQETGLAPGRHEEFMGHVGEARRSHGNFAGAMQGRTPRFHDYYPGGRGPGAYARYEDEEEDPEEFGGDGGGEDEFEAGEEAGFGQGEEAGFGGGEEMGFEEGQGEAQQGIEPVINALEMAIQELQDYCGGGGEQFPEAGEEGMGPPSTPIPEEAPTQNAYARRPSRRPSRGARYSSNPQYRYQDPETSMRYRRSAQPGYYHDVSELPLEMQPIDPRDPWFQQQQQPPQQPRRGGSGSVQAAHLGHRLGQTNYELQVAQAQIQMLMAERDEADTAACESEIARLAQMGYMVDDYEVHQLKMTPYEERGNYIAYIMDRIQRVGTEQLPPVLGDPTPGPAPDISGPMTQQEMQRALSLAGHNADPTTYKRAIAQVMYERANGPVQYQQFQPQQMPQYMQPVPTMPIAPQPPQDLYGDGYHDFGATPLSQYARPENPMLYDRYAQAQPQPQVDPVAYQPPAGSVLNRDPYGGGGFDGGFGGNPGMQMAAAMGSVPNDNSGW